MHHLMLFQHAMYILDTHWVTGVHLKCNMLHLAYYYFPFVPWPVRVFILYLQVNVRLKKSGDFNLVSGGNKNVASARRVGDLDQPVQSRWLKILQVDQFFFPFPMDLDLTLVDENAQNKLVNLWPS